MSFYEGNADGMIDAAKRAQMMPIFVNGHRACIDATRVFRVGRKWPC
jgi:hypothetical protein